MSKTPQIENDFLPPGALTLLIGDPGIGKSLLALDIAARLSQSRPPFPNTTATTAATATTATTNVTNPTPPPLTTIISSAEDTDATLLSRFRAAHGNANHIYLLAPSVTLSPKSDNPQLLAFLNVALPTLQKQNKPPALLILDPLPHFLGTFDGSHAASVRRILTPLLQLAAQHRFAILGITHLNKSTRAKSTLHRALNSIAYVALARSVLLLTPNDHNPVEKLLIPIKSNLSHPTHALAFTITTAPSPTPSPAATAAEVNAPQSEGAPSPTPNAPTPPSPGTAVPAAPIIEYTPTPITHHPLLNGTHPQPHSNALANSQLDLAEHFLRTTLKDGPLPSADLLKQARTLALSQRTLERARQNLRISVRYDPPTGQWLVALPDPPN